MLTVHDIDRLPLYEEKGRDGTRKRVGKVVEVLFHPDKPVVVGLMVERPDILFLIRRKDLIVALDATKVLDDKVVVDGPKAWGKSAGRRLGIDWAKSVIWKGQPVSTESGEKLGYVRDAVFSEEDGHLNGLGLTSGIAADVTIGTKDLPAKFVRGWDGTKIVVSDEALAIQSDGGAAAVAGRTTAVATHVAVAGAVAATESAKKAAAYAQSAAKVAAKSQTAKRTMRFLKSVRDQVVDAAGLPDDDKKKSK